MSLLTLFLSLKAAIEERDWKTVLNLVADLVKQFTGPAPDAQTAADLDDAVAGVRAAVDAAKHDTVEVKEKAAISPDLVMKLILVALELWAAWRQKK
jgi:hypothetical protein